MTTLKERLQNDLQSAIRQRAELESSTVRLVLTAIKTEEVAGKEPRTLSDDDVLKVLQREVKKRREAAEAFDGGGRTERAERERAEATVIQTYLPAQLGDEELVALVTAAVAETGATEPRQMGLVMKAVQPKVAGRADGKRISAEVRRQLGG